MKFKLPPRKALVWTNYEDPIKYYYYPFIGYFYRKRVQTVLNLMKHYFFNTLMDVGYGCGILYPTLKRHAKELYGVETHGKEKEVTESMKRLGVDVNLIPGSVLDLSKIKKKFDALLLVSILEHIKDIDKAVDELASIHTDKGMIFVGSPVKNKITDAIFTLFGFDYEKHHPSSHRDILRALSKKYKILKLRTFPKHVPLDYALYFSVAGVKK